MSGSELRWGTWTGAGLTLALVLIAGCRPAEVPRTRGHDPWVFRSVLDGRPRVLTAALAPDFWVAYDTRHAALYRVWAAGVNFDGAVYNAHHGPNPMSMGPAGLISSVERPWRVVRGDRDLRSVLRYRGHRFQDGQVHLLYALALEDGTVIEVDERPEAIPAENGGKALERVFTVRNVPSGARVLMDFNDVTPPSTAGARVTGNGKQPESTLTLQPDAPTRLVMTFPSAAAAGQAAGGSASESAESLIARSDCVACHDPTVRTIGPSFKEVAERYRTNDDTVAGLARKIIEGGDGAWGNVPMISHLSLKPEEAALMVRYILTNFDPSDAHGTQTTHPLASPDEEESEKDEAPALRPGRPGDRRPLAGVHPSFAVSSLRPQAFKPMVGGLDFLPDGRLVLSTWDARGSVYVLGNLDSADPEKISVKEIASGLYEPLGLKVVDGAIYVLQKQELTRLVDLNGDGITDEYRTVSDAWGMSDNFHEFAFGLVYRDGYFYGTLATAIQPGGVSAQPQLQDRGTVMKIAQDGATIEYVARGLRVPNGIGPGVDDELFVSDNQGDWLPSSKILHLRPGAFYGSHAVDPAGTKDTPVTAPVAWLPQDELANSPSQPLRLDVGPYRNQMLYGDVTHGGLNRIVTQKVEGKYQGCVIPFTQGLEAGVNRAITGPDGAIYVGGIGNPGNWGHEGKLWYGLQRLKYTGAPTFEMLDVQLHPDGLEVTFTEPLRAGDGDEIRDYEIKRWRYVPTAEYGGPKVDERPLSVRSVRVSPDRRRVFLDVAGIEAGHVVYLRLASPMLAESNRELWATETWCTVNAMPKGLAGDRFGGAQSPAVNTLTDAERAAGWRLLFDGRSTHGWRNFRSRTLDPRWKVSDGTLSLAAGGGGGDIVTEEEFGDFELELEWQIARAGNSGIFYRVSETAEEIWQWAPEMQVLDDERHEDRVDPVHRAGSAYDLYAPSLAVTRPAGEFNEARLVVRGPHVEHWLNGRKVVEYDTSSAEWARRLAASKFASFPQFAASRRGRIGLQDHGDAVRFRNIRIRPL